MPKHKPVLKPKPKIAHAISKSYFEQFGNPGIARILLDPDYAEHQRAIEVTPPERGDTSPLPLTRPRAKGPER